MIKKIFIINILSLYLLGVDYVENCTVPKILIETVQLTENETSYPFYIRLNEKPFNEVLERFTYKRMEYDKALIDCLNKENCISIAEALTQNNIKNIDLGLHQVNYYFYPNSINTYFDKILSLQNACEVIEDKIRYLKKWDWETLASYHSTTPKLNKIYKEKLIKNYIKLINR